MSLAQGNLSNISIAYRGFTNWDYKDRLKPIDYDPFDDIDKEYPVNFKGKGKGKPYVDSITPNRQLSNKLGKIQLQNKLSARSLTKPG